MKKSETMMPKIICKSCTICYNCKFWTPKDNGFGECFCDKFKYSSCVSFKNESNDTLLYGDSEMYAAFFYTGENFGCVHFRTK